MVVGLWGFCTGFGGLTDLSGSRGCTGFRFCFCRGFGVGLPLEVPEPRYLQGLRFPMRQEFRIPIACG